jgi:hypothetical protein
VLKLVFLHEFLLFVLMHMLRGIALEKFVQLQRHFLRLTASQSQPDDAAVRLRDDSEELEIWKVIIPKGRALILLQREGVRLEGGEGLDCPQFGRGWQTGGNCGHEDLVS